MIWPFFLLLELLFICAIAAFTVAGGINGAAVVVVVVVWISFVSLPPELFDSVLIFAMWLPSAADCVLLLSTARGALLLSGNGDTEVIRSSFLSKVKFAAESATNAFLLSSGVAAAGSVSRRTHRNNVARVVNMHNFVVNCLTTRDRGICWRHSVNAIFCIWMCDRGSCGESTNGFACN